MSNHNNKILYQNFDKDEKIESTNSVLQQIKKFIKKIDIDIKKK